MGYFNVTRSGEEASKAVRIRSVFPYGFGVGWQVRSLQLPRAEIPKPGTLASHTNLESWPSGRRHWFAKPASGESCFIGSNPILSTKFVYK